MSVSMGELEVALKCFSRDKSPGPDGWPMEFYIFFFDLIGSDILLAIQEYITYDRMYEGFNSTFLALIPKVDKPLSFDDFHPISLYNCIYKLISKIIALCIKHIISRMISKE